MSIAEHLEPFSRLSKDILKGLRQQGGGVTTTEARFLVDMYYQSQKNRIQLNNQIKGLGRDAKKESRPEEPHELLNWAFENWKLFETQVQKAMSYYVETHPMSYFFEQTVGVGPIISAGMLSHIDIHKAPTVGHIWRFAGYDPSVKWQKGQKRPWNASLKTLCWKCGDSFVKFSGRKDAYYGQVYRQRKQYEVDRNDRGENAKRAAQILKDKKWGKDTEAYKAYSIGKLPPGHIDAQARRYAVKLFLSHLHWRWYEEEFDTAPPKPYIIEHGGHVHMLEPPQVKTKGNESTNNFE